VRKVEWRAAEDALETPKEKLEARVVREQVGGDDVG
jgi:hypothetical protein